MRLIHTSDWHLGHTLHGMGREVEHQDFLSWLLDLLERERVDALIVAGDVFDSANPPASAQSMYYGFLAEVCRRVPGLDVVITGGNHDSAARLDAPRELLQALRVHVVGGVPYAVDGGVDGQRLCVPIRNTEGAVAGWCVALPYLRPADLPPVGDRLLDGVKELHQQVFAAANAVRQPGQALVATGHCFMVGCAVSEVSERRVVCGGQHALPLDVYPDEVDYVALGHLHLAQAVGRREHVRYSGAPIPLALDEATYPHQVVRVDFVDGALHAVEPIRVPKAVEIIRLPEQGPEPLEAVLDRLTALPSAGGDPERAPFLQVSVKLERPEPGLRQAIDRALEGKGVRLLRIVPHYSGRSEALAEAVPERNLCDLAPAEVFALRYRREHDSEPPPELVSAFDELLESVRQGGAA